MHQTYYTLQALAHEWSHNLTHCVIGDAFSQDRDELTLALADPGHEWMLRFSTRSPFRFVFRSEGYHKARRNTATLFAATFGRTVTTVRTAERDRMLFLDLDDGTRLQAVLFGPRANIFWVDAEGIIREAFQGNTSWQGKVAPLPRPATRVTTFEGFEAACASRPAHLEQALAAAFPLFDRTLAAEAIYRAGISKTDWKACDAKERLQLFETAQSLESDLTHPRPRLYWQDQRVATFSLIPLHHVKDLREEPFDTVDGAIQVFVRRMLAQQRFDQVFLPLKKTLEKAYDDAQTRLERMLEELSHDSRADRYERWGHLLMASPSAVPPRATEITLPDLFAENLPITIPLDPALTAIENATRYYEKARHTRTARENAEVRLVATEEHVVQSANLLDRLNTLTTYADVQRFKEDEAERLAPFLSSQKTTDHIPFRRIDLGKGYEVWVGRNASQNEALTFQHARKFDLWLHARGVPGSHVLLRLPHRQAQPGRPILERAASIAAYYSKARGSGLVPVIVTPRKYVRKAKGAAAGSVIVEREEVLIVPPQSFE